MIEIFTRRTLDRRSALRDQMFHHRAQQFVQRLKWEIGCDDQGREIDQYDALDPHYVVVVGPDGQHRASLRALPTTGRTMIGEHFAELTTDGWQEDGVVECTRLCIAPGAGGDAAPELLLGGMELGLSMGWSSSLGVFDARMMRVYARIGWPVEKISQIGEGRHALCLCRWYFDRGLRDAMAARWGLALDQAACRELRGRASDWVQYL